MDNWGFWRREWSRWNRSNIDIVEENVELRKDMFV